MIYDKYEASSILCFRSPPAAAAAWSSGSPAALRIHGLGVLEFSGPVKDRRIYEVVHRFSEVGYCNIV